MPYYPGRPATSHPNDRTAESATYLLLPTQPRTHTHKRSTRFNAWTFEPASYGPQAAREHEEETFQATYAQYDITSSLTVLIAHMPTIPKAHRLTVPIAPVAHTPSVPTAHRSTVPTAHKLTVPIAHRPTVPIVQRPALS